MIDESKCPVKIAATNFVSITLDSELSWRMLLNSFTRSTEMTSTIGLFAPSTDIYTFQKIVNFILKEINITKHKHNQQNFLYIKFQLTE